MTFLSLKLFATTNTSPWSAVETVWKTQTDATALRRGDSRSRLQREVSSVCGCHGLVPWRLTLLLKLRR